MSSFLIDAFASVPALEASLAGLPELDNATLVLALSGWMDGGEVSTGTVKRLVDLLQAEPLAEIDPDPFYLYSFPGSMEVAALFRPHIKIEDGLVIAHDMAARYGRVLVIGAEKMSGVAFGDPFCRVDFHRRIARPRQHLGTDAERHVVDHCSSLTTACPPNSFRSAAIIFIANESSCRDAKRANNASAVIGTGTFSSIASSK